MSKQFVLGVDLDGVCANFYEGMRPIAAEWLGVPLSSLPKKVGYGLKEWKLDQAPGGYEDLHKFAVTQRELFARLKPINGAPQVLRILSKNDIRIRIITHRLYIKNFHQKAVQQTIEWLDNYDIPYWDLCFMKDKTEVGANLYIDDSPTNIQQLKESNCPTIIFSNSTNLSLKGPRAKNWIEVEKMVMAQYKIWKSHRKEGSGK